METIGEQVYNEIDFFYFIFYFILLPIREAYEWKPESPPILQHILIGGLLPILEAYEWKRPCSPCGRYTAPKRLASNS